MERPVITTVSGVNGDEVRVLQTGPGRDPLRMAADHTFLRLRFPQHCPYHLLHNLLELHYGKHEWCTARPFSVDQCKYGSHSKPVLTEDQMRVTAPAEGALILLPFGLSCRSCDDGIGLVAGCAECGLFSTDSSACGGCRRVGASTPASADVLPNGRTASLAAWQEAVGMGEQEPADHGWQEEEMGAVQEDEEEWDDEEEMGDTGEDEWYEEEAYEEEEWEGEADAEGEGEDGYSHGDWSRDRHGNWQWSVDFTAAKAADVAPLQPAEGLAEVVAAAVQAAVASAQAAAAGPSLSERAPASAQDATSRARILELELQLQELKQKHGM